MTLNESAYECADLLAAKASAWRCAVTHVAGARIIDCGGAVVGGLQAGLQLARVCMAGLGEVTLVPHGDGLAVQVSSDDPVRACMAAQYAGWQVKVGKFFAMGSGPMRAAYGKEALFNDIPHCREEPPCAVGVLEANHHPTGEVLAYLVERLPKSVEKITLAVAPASSMAGNIQVVARCLETALHKLHELKFDLSQVVSGYGIAPLPPEGKDHLQAMGRPNDAILYGGRVVLWVRADDELLDQIGPKVPSCSSGDHGTSFAELFKRYNGDFYKIDGHLFAPAVVEFRNVHTGRVHVFGRMEPGVLRQSFGL